MLEGDSFLNCELRFAVKRTDGERYFLARDISISVDSCNRTRRYVPLYSQSVCDGVMQNRDSAATIQERIRFETFPFSDDNNWHDIQSNERTRCFDRIVMQMVADLRTDWSWVSERYDRSHGWTDDVLFCNHQLHMGPCQDNHCTCATY